MVGNKGLLEEWRRKLGHHGGPISGWKRARRVHFLSDGQEDITTRSFDLDSMMVAIGQPKHRSNVVRQV